MYLNNSKNITSSYHTLEGLTFKEDLYLFYNADIIFSQHGGALTNIFFSTPHTVLIECTPPYFYEFYYAANAYISQVHYILVSTFYPKVRDNLWLKAEKAYQQGTYYSIHRRYVHITVNPPIFNVISAVTDAMEYLKRWRYVYEVNDKWSPFFYFTICAL